MVSGGGGGGYNKNFCSTEINLHRTRAEQARGDSAGWTHKLRHGAGNTRRLVRLLEGVTGCAARFCPLGGNAAGVSSFLLRAGVRGRRRPLPDTNLINKDVDAGYHELARRRLVLAGGACVEVNRGAVTAHCPGPRQLPLSDTPTAAEQRSLPFVRAWDEWRCCNGGVWAKAINGVVLERLACLS